MTKRIWFLLLCLAIFHAFSQPNDSNESKAGLIYGKDNSYFISAPDGWILDNESGRNQGLFAVLYPKGSTWNNAVGMMYSKAIRKDSEINSIEAYVKNDLNEFKKEAPKIKVEFKNEIKLDKNRIAMIFEWSGDEYGNIESSAYIEEKNVIVLITYNCRSMEFYKTNYSKFIETVRSYSFFTDKVNVKK
jgi:hypothetical protein